MRFPHFSLLFAGLFLLSTCDSVVTDPPKAENIIPLDSLVSDIPDPLSNFQSNQKIAAADEIQGSELYEALRVYIGLAEESAYLVRSVLSIIHAYNLQGPRTFSFTGDDGRTKNVSVVGDVLVGAKTWSYRLEIENDGGNKAFQFFWDTGPVFEAIAVLDLYEMDNIEHPDVEGMLMEIRTSGNSGAGFKRSMEVLIDDHPKEPGEDDGYVDNLRMLVTDFGDEVLITGNSNHPDLILFDSTQGDGISYSFVGRGSKSLDIGVVKLAIPPSSLTDISNVFVNYSVDTVFRTEILNLYPSIHPDTLDALLVNTKIPAFFDQNGFISAGTVPNNPGFTNSFIDLSGLQPFVPRNVRDMELNFY